MTINLGVFIGLISIVSMVFGMIISYMKWRKYNDKDIKLDAAGNGELRADIGYIKRGVEDIKLDLKAQENRYSELSERVTRVEESTKSAHKRIDEIKGIKKDEGAE